MNKCKNAVIEHVKIISFHPFRHLSGASVIFDLLDTHDFTQNEIRKGVHTHVAPRFAVVVVFALHEGLRLRSNLLVLYNGFMRLQGILQIRGFSDLYNGHDAIIDYSLKSVFKTFAHQIFARFLNGANALCFDKELIS